MKFDSKKRMILLNRQEEERKKRFMEFTAFYKSNKQAMISKVKNVYRQIIQNQVFDKEIVNFNFSNFHDTRIEQLSNLLPYFTNIKVLKLWKANIGAGIKNICIQLSNMSKLEILSLEDNSFSQSDSDYLSVVIAKLKNLKELWLHINDLGPIGAHKLSSSLTHLKNLEKLGLDENLIEDQGVTYIFESIKSFKNLKFLGLGYNLISEEICIKILESPLGLYLQKIILSGNRITQNLSEKFKNTLPNINIAI